MIEESLSGLLSYSEMAALRDAISKPAARCIRLRPDRIHINPLPMAVEVIPWFTRGRLLVDSNIRPSQSLHFAAADYYIQDSGSLLALALLDAQPNEAICDLCAAPGGKASGIGEALGERGFLLANEPIGSRTAILRYTLARTGNPRYAVTQQDPAQIAIRFQGLFDAVLVDAPCSGQSMVGRGKRAGNAFDRKQVEHSAKRQQRILLAACKLLKPGGRLVYSTCTFATEENEAQIRFLQRCFPGAWQPILSSALERWTSPIEPGCYRQWPHRDPTAGAFAAGLRLKKAISPESSASDSETFGRGRQDRSSIHRRPSESAIANEGMKAFGEISRLRIKALAGGDVFGIADDIPEEIGKRLDEREWPKIATVRANIWKPAYSLAMLDAAWFHPARRWEIEAPEAQKYMRGEALTAGNDWIFADNPASKLGKPNGRQPWATVNWDQKPLGWVKFADDRVNNHLPKLAILPIRTLE